jgi:hypothetical protein
VSDYVCAFVGLGPAKNSLSMVEGSSKSKKTKSGGENWSRDLIFLNRKKKVKIVSC